MGRLAWSLVIAGLVIGLAGELLIVIQDEQAAFSIWQAVGVGASITAFGLLLLVRRPLYARLLRRRSRLIIVARDEVALYNYIRRDQLGDEPVKVIRDRRRADRRHWLEAHAPDRRRAERRRYDIAALLLTQGWAQVKGTDLRMRS
jgi:hypothetical protein